MPKRPKNFDIRQYLLDNSVEAPNGCRVWGLSTDGCGYGRLKYNGQQVAHRVAFGVWNEIPENRWDLLPEVVMHSCDNPPCIADNHLIGGTYKSNNDDAKSKGRSRYRAIHGEDNQSSKLLNDDIIPILKLRASGWKLREIAEIYGVSHTTISLICRGKMWCRVRESNPCYPAENRTA